MGQKQNFVYQIRATRLGFGPEMTPDEIQTMSDHFEYLKRLYDEGKLVMAGPTLDFAFGLCILETETEEEARALMLADPSVVRGVMQPEFHAIRLSLWANRYLGKIDPFDPAANPGQDFVGDSVAPGRDLF